MQNTAQFWDNLAEKYARSPIRDMDAYTTSLNRTRSYLSATDRVLEVGCGTGSTALLLAENVEHITASDVSAKMIEIGKRKAQDQNITNVSFVTSDVSGEGISGGPFDVVMALNLLHLLRDLPSALRQINQQLKPGGLFISKTVCELTSGTPIKFRLMKILIPLMQLVGKAPYVKFMPIQELEDTISAAGFKIIETGNYPAAPPCRYVVAKKVANI